MQKLLATGIAVIFCTIALPACADEPLVPDDKFVYCTVCHGAQLRGNIKTAAPRLSEMENWYVVRQLKAFKNGSRGVHGNDALGMEMQPMAAILSDDEIEQVADYVSQVESPVPAATVEGDTDRGASLYTSCSVCHGPNAEGNEGLGAPGLVGRSDWYLVTQLANYRSGARGGSTSDMFGVQMRAAASTLADEEDIRDVVAYINTLQSE